MSGVPVDFYELSSLKNFDVIPVTPTNDHFHLAGTMVTAESVADAFVYLIEAGGWRDLEDQGTVRGRYQMIERRNSAPVFHGTKGEWILAVQLGYMPRPVRFSATALTQHRVDRKRALDAERHRQLVWELTRPNLYDHIRHWYRQQRYHPLRWKVIGTVTLVGFLSLFWNLTWPSVVGMFLFYCLFRWVRSY